MVYQNSFFYYTWMMIWWFYIDKKKNLQIIDNQIFKVSKHFLFIKFDELDKEILNKWYRTDKITSLVVYVWSCGKHNSSWHSHIRTSSYERGVWRCVTVCVHLILNFIHTNSCERCVGLVDRCGGLVERCSGLVVSVPVLRSAHRVVWEAADRSVNTVQIK